MNWLLRFTAFASYIYCTRGDIVKGPGGDIFVQLSTGNLRGKTIVTKSGNRGHAFLGVPYAEPPVADYRFAETKRKRRWLGTIDCLEYKAACMQNSSDAYAEPQHPISEDCLYANVFAGTNCTSSNPCPVLYYIHGGGHNYDSPRMFPPDLMVDNFASTGLVMVTIGYRLGTFGFWNTGNDVAPGNWAIYDMREGLRWVRREVENFGGNKKAITVMGHSSSAIDVGLIGVSPIFQGLFHRMIIMSGSGYAAGVLNDNAPLAQLIAQKAGCLSSDIKKESPETDSAVLKCMRSLSAEELTGWQRVIEADQQLSWSGPRMDGPQGFFPQDPLVLAATRVPYPTLTGSTLYEFSPPGAIATLPNMTRSEFKSTCKTMAPGLLPSSSLNDVSLDKVADLCANFYDRNDGFRSGLLKLLSDNSMFLPIFLEAASISATQVPVYLYSFDYVKKGMEGFFPIHAQDLTWVMGIHPFPFDDRDRQIQKIYPPLFANFAKYGNPTPWHTEENAWKPLEYPIGSNYYKIDLPAPTNKQGYHGDSVVFWRSLAPRIAGENQLNHHTSQAEPNSQDGVRVAREKLLQLQESIGILSIQSQAGIKAASGGNSTVILEEANGTDWQTAFWITVAVAALIVLALGFSIGLSCCTTRNKNREMELYEDNEAFTERSPIKSGPPKFYS